MYFGKNHKLILIASFFLFLILPLSGTHPVLSAPPPKISAKSAILMDAKTGQILYEKNITKKLPPASTTKILTAIIALESGRLHEMVKVSPKASSVRGSSIHLKSGQIISLEELIEGLLLRSGNDAAEAIAEYLSGTVEEFAAVMNQKAVVLGAKDSYFKNPHGLNSPEHMTTTLDLANITRYALTNEKFAKIVSTKETDIEWFDRKGTPREETIRNTNKLLWMMDDADGVKTGTTSQAGPCLVSSATRNNHRLIAVVLNDSSRWYDSMRLLKYGLESFEYVEYAKKGSVLAFVPVEDGMKEAANAVLSQDAALSVAKDDYPNFQIRIKNMEKIKAPVVQGQKVGELIFYLKDEQIKSIDLLAGENIEKATLSRLFFKNIVNLSRKLSNWGAL